MKNLVIIGAGGFFREVYEYLIEDSNFETSFVIKGVLEDADVCTQSLVPFLGKIDEYFPEDNDIFLIAIGNTLVREKFFNSLKKKGAVFYTLIHPLAKIATSAKVGEGCIIAPFSIVNANAILDYNVVLNVHCSVGHDSVVGFSSVLSPFSAVNGNCNVGSLCFLGTRSTVFPGKIVGEKSIVDSHSYVKSDVPAKSIVSFRGEYVVVQNRLMR